MAVRKRRATGYDLGPCKTARAGRGRGEKPREQSRPRSRNPVYGTHVHAWRPKKQLLGVRRALHAQELFATSGELLGAQRLHPFADLRGARRRRQLLELERHGARRVEALRRVAIQTLEN